MLRIGICDDNREDIARIKELAVRFSEEHPETPVQIQAYGQPYDLLDEIEKAGGFDLYLLDVVMPHMTGVAWPDAPGEKRAGRDPVFDSLQGVCGGRLQRKGCRVSDQAGEQAGL